MSSGLPSRSQVRRAGAYDPVPQGYFEQLPDRVLARRASCRASSARVGRAVRLARWLSGVAAAVALLVGVALRAHLPPPAAALAQHQLAGVDDDILTQFLMEETPFSDAEWLDWLAEQPAAAAGAADPDRRPETGLEINEETDALDTW